MVEGLRQGLVITAGCLLEATVRRSLEATRRRLREVLEAGWTRRAATTAEQVSGDEADGDDSED